jgi:hypothetical protein
VVDGRPVTKSFPTDLPRISILGGVGKKAAGYTFLGDASVHLIRECLSKGSIETSPESKLIPRSYGSVWAAINRARTRIELASNIQPCHGCRKYFENAEVGATPSPFQQETQ